MTQTSLQDPPRAGFRDASELDIWASDDSADGVGGARVVESLVAANQTPLDRGGRKPLPSRRVARDIAEDLRTVLFPWHFGPEGLTSASLRGYLSSRIDRVRTALTEQVARCLVFDCEHGAFEPALGCRQCERRAPEVVERLIASLPRIKALLESDARAAYDGDPAVRFFDETIFCYPGLAAILQHRIAHELHLQAVPLLPRILSELAHSQTGIDIHPGAEIGESFFIDHGTGVVIGETCSIGKRVRIYQGVTLGARGFDEQDQLLKGIPRHPLVEDDVVIYAGATILGRITIGKGATIGGNVWLTRSVVPGGRVSQSHVRHGRFRDGAGI